MKIASASAVLATALLIALPGAVGATSDPGRQERGANGFVKHQGTNWVWFGPRSWDAYYSPYGITIFAPASDGSAIDYGGSSIFCDGSPQQHFAGQRNAFINNPGLSRVKLRQISNIKQTGGTFSQTLKWSGRANGKNIGGTLGMQYASYDGTYCYQATLYKGAVDDRNFKSSLKTVEAVWDRTAYSGPGLVINPNTGLPRQR